MQLGFLDLEGNFEREAVLKTLKDGRRTEENRHLLLHVLNISTRRVPCAYFGRFRDETGVNFREGDYNKIERCLVLESSTSKKRVVACPFYGENLEGRCSYSHNRR